VSYQRNCVRRAVQDSQDHLVAGKPLYTVLTAPT
jgi:hypothetical protein